MADLLIAAVDHAHDLPLYTRSPDDFMRLQSLVITVAV
jgi:predicted nucleic acid-binding protein